MKEIIEFNARNITVCERNLESFIQKNKEFFLFKSSNWDDNIWNLTDFLSHKLVNHREKKVYFRSFQDNLASRTSITVPLTQPLLDFAKATFCEIMRVNKLSEFKRIVYSIQALEFALSQQKRLNCVTEITIDTLVLAEQYIRDKYQNPWSIAKNLENLINNIIVHKELNPVLVTWKSSITYVAPIRNDRVQRTESERKSKLPHLEELLAIADIHHTSTHVPDKIVTSFVLLSLFAPSRGTEVLSLPVNCIVQNTYQLSKSTQIPLGLIWNPLKGGDRLVKYSVNDEFSKLTEDAVNYLINIGRNARKASEWYCINPKKLYLPDGLEYLRDSPVTLWEVSKIIGKSNTIKACHADRYNFSKPVSKTSDVNRMQNSNATWVSLYSFQELEKYVLSLLPIQFPILDGRNQQKWHESLFVLPRNILSPTADTIEYIPQAIDIDQINKQLGSNPSKITIFSRHNKKLSNGAEMSITTHQFRHLLNTLAQSKSLSQELIAFWSGRKSVKQNDVYNHITQESIIDAYKFLNSSVKSIPQQGYLNEKVSKIATINSISYDDALKIELGSTHITRYGICRHDFSLTPCPKDKDCGNCGELSVMKGNEKHLIEAQNLVNLLNKAVTNAVLYLNDGHSGAKKWLDVNEPKLERWNTILRFLKDETIKHGTLFTLKEPINHQTKVGLAFDVKELAKTQPSEEDLIIELMTSK